MKTFLTVVAVLALATAGFHLRSSVRDRIALSESQWRLSPGFFPAWFPPGFEGAAADLLDLPERVPLRSVRWSDELVSAIETNPWIDRVVRIDRSGDEIEFRAEFVRPLVALRTRSGFLLLDSQGAVIDHQPGERLRPEWGIPYFIPRPEVGPDVAAGTRFDEGVYEELLSLADTLWRFQTFRRWPGLVQELLVRGWEEEDPHWYLSLPPSTVLKWGRAPSADRLSAVSSTQKLRNLAAVLEARDRLEPGMELDLSLGREPVVVPPR